MSKFKPFNDNQFFLLPPRVEEFISESHLARVVKEIVSRLDLSKIEDKYSDRGQKSYHPSLLLSIMIYGYAIGVRSGREIAKKCEGDLAFMYLASMHKPDFRTINDFRKNNIELFTNFFVEVLQICRELGMVKVGTIAIDGMKCRASASSKRSKTKAEYEKWLKKLKGEVDELMEEANRIDENEDDEFGEDRGDQLPKSIRKKKNLISKIEYTLDQINTDKDKVNLTDPDAKFIKDGGVIKPNYSGQIAVTEEGIITATSLKKSTSESKQLIGLIEQTEENTNEKVGITLADAGFSSYENYEWFARENKVCYIPDQELARSKKKKYKDQPKGNKVYAKSQFIYDKQADQYICPAKKKVKRTKYTKSEGDRKYNIYQCFDCQNCPLKEKCTTTEYRKIKREIREDIRDRSIAKLKTPEGEKIYNKRGWMVETKFGHFKFNLGYKMFSLRSLTKVSGEFDLICLANNIFKIYQSKLSQ